MNTLYIIGNGFDLAHGLKTSYSDFLLWYFKQCLEKLNFSGEYDDILLRMEGFVNVAKVSKLRSIELLLKECSANSVHINYSSEFIRSIFTIRTNNWVDIESAYYSCLLFSLKYSSHQTEDRDKYIKCLNSEFSYLKQKLIEYLNEIDKTIVIKNEIQNHFMPDEFSNFKRDKHLVLNFNYTTTVKQYITPLAEFESINIHGTLNDSSNPIIFGYGDEMHHEYENLERLNVDDCLINFKSFGYLRNSNYVLLLSFLNIGAFRVKLLGHSCGLSDRVLLSTIFEHINCHMIAICYHKKSEIEDDHYEKTIRISRHFSTSKKDVMRERVLPHGESKYLLSP